MLFCGNHPDFVVMHACCNKNHLYILSQLSRLLRLIYVHAILLPSYKTFSVTNFPDQHIFEAAGGAIQAISAIEPYIFRSESAAWIELNISYTIDDTFSTGDLLLRTLLP